MRYLLWLSNYVPCRHSILPGSLNEAGNCCCWLRTGGIAAEVQSGVCLIEAGCFNVFTSDGRDYVAALPFPVWLFARARARAHTHTFNSPLFGTTRVSRYQKGKTNLDSTEARDSEWQRNLLGHMQVCTSLQTDNHASTPPLSFLQAGCPSCRPANSVKALKAVALKAIWCMILYTVLNCHVLFSCLIGYCFV